MATVWLGVFFVLRFTDSFILTKPGDAERRDPSCALTRAGAGWEGTSAASFRTNPQPFLDRAHIAPPSNGCFSLFAK